MIVIFFFISDRIIAIFSHHTSHSHYLSSCHEWPIICNNYFILMESLAIRFSYWMANNAPFSENERLKLLRMNSVLERLLFIWKAIKKLTETNTNGYSFITCNICEIPFTTVSNVFTVCGAEGTTSTYVNRSGFIHQITTLRNVDTHKISFQGNPSTENRYDNQTINDMRILWRPRSLYRFDVLKEMST